MYVRYRTLHRSVRVYELTRVAFCCARMAKSWSGLLGFGARNGIPSTSCTVNLCVDRPQSNGRSILEMVPIRYCPFCGAEIVLRCADRAKTPEGGLARAKQKPRIA